MPTAPAQRVFLPFRTLGTHGQLHLHGVRVDGRAVTVGAADTLDLSEQERPQWIELDLAVELPVDLRDVLDRDERVPRDVRVVAIAEDPATWYRAAVRLQPDAPPSLRGTLRIEGRAVDREVTVRAVVSRANPAAAPRPGLPEARGALLMTSPPLTLRLRPATPQGPPGGFLAVRWRPFSDPPMAAWAGQPWRLQLDDAPVLWLNQDQEELVRTLQGASTTGRRARLRDLLFRTIGASVWPTLLHAAAAGLAYDADGAPVYAQDWHREALSVAADWTFGDLPRVQRLDRLLGLLAEARSDPSALPPLLEELALGVARGLDLAPVVARALSELAEDRRE